MMMLLQNNNKKLLNELKKIDFSAGDNGFKPIFEASKKFLIENKDYEIIAFCIEKDFNQIKNNSVERLILKKSNSIVESKDTAIQAIRKKDSSMNESIMSTVNGETSATISAGASGPLTTLSFLNSRSINSQLRPAFAPMFTSRDGEIKVALDVGANLDVDANTLLSFAKMGSIFYESLENSNNAKVGLLNIGSEPSKGDQLRQDAYKVLSNSKEINFIGNVEGDEFLVTKADVIVTDAYSGNIALKTIEGTLKIMGEQIKKSAKNPFGFIGFIFLKKSLKKNLEGVSQKGKIGGAIILGINHLIVKVHGSSQETNYYNALLMCKKLIENNLISKVKEKFN